jgi:secretion/DNA translocation related CpaE-like protein
VNRRRSSSLATPPQQTPSTVSTVLVSRDRPLVDHVTALAEAVGVKLDIIPATGAVPRTARLVLVGLDAAGRVRPGRRGTVLVVRVEGADPPDGVWRQAVALGVEHVAVLPESEGWLIERLLDASGPDRRAPVVAVAGACGGSGASSLAISLAVTAASHGLRPVLLDADPLGGGIDLPLGADSIAGLRWPDLPWSDGRLPVGIIGSSLPQVEGIRLLTCPRGEVTTLTPPMLTSVLAAATRESDLVVVDLPRHVGDAETAILSRCTLVLLIVPCGLRGVAAGGQVAAALESRAADVRVVVREPFAPGLGPEAVAEALLLPLQGPLSPEPGLAAVLDSGEAAALRRRGPLATFSRRVLVSLLEQE